MTRKSSSKIPLSSRSGEPRSGTRDVSSSKFELIAELGRGGMATVYLARAKKRPERLIVLKQLRADLADNSEFLAMFLEEARLAGKLRHPNIVETYEVGQDDGTYYIAMEYLEGLSLQAVLTKFGWKGDFSFPLQVWILIEALKALEHAYTQRDDDGTPLKIVHRDVSPPNIIVTFDGQVKLVDFGIAKAANSNVETRTGLIKGKLTYMAPEQAASGDVDSRTDIYSVGVMLWQAAAGTRRWKGIENTEVLKRLHEGDVAEPPNAKKNGLPVIVDDIVLNAIAAEPERRYKSANAFAAVLESLLRELKSEANGKELASFMSKHFGDARERAAKVMELRIRELDQKSGDGRPKDKESVTAIRTSAVRQAPHRGKGSGNVSEKESSESVQVKPSGDKPQVGGAAAALAKKVSRPITPAKLARTSRDSEPGHTETKASPSTRKSRAVPIAVVGIVAAAALAFLAFRSRNVEPAAPTPPPNTSPVTANDSPPIAAPIATPLPTANAAPTVAAPAANDPLAQGKTNALPQNPAHHHHAHGPNAAVAPAPAPQPVVPIAVPPPTPAVALTPPPSPATTAPPADGDHPSIDKQDPWKQGNSTKVDKTDPWGNPGAAGSARSDPWAK